MASKDIILVAESSVTQSRAAFLTSLSESLSLSISFSMPLHWPKKRGKRTAKRSECEESRPETVILEYLQTRVL